MKGSGALFAECAVLLNHASERAEAVDGRPPVNVMVPVSRQREEARFGAIHIREVS